MTRVLLTGATGFIGSHVIRHLIDRGYEVHCLSRSRIRPDRGDVSWHHADLFDPAQVRRVIDEVKANSLLHLAWNAEPGVFWTALDNLRWTAASLELTLAFAAAGGRRAVFAGTCAEYDWTHDRLVEASTPIRPATLYGKSKAALWSMLEAAAPTLGLSVAWGRIFFLYGPREHPKRLVPYVVTSLLSGEPVLLTEATQERDFMHVDDVARAFAELLASNASGAVNIASGFCLPLKQIIFRIAERVGSPDLLRFGSRPATNEPPRLAADITILREEVGFRPRYDLNAGLDDTVAWWRARQRHAAGQ